MRAIVSRAGSIRAALVVGLFAFAGLAASACSSKSDDDSGGCRSDNECAAGRVCDNGTCVNSSIGQGGNGSTGGQGGSGSGGGQCTANGSSCTANGDCCSFQQGDGYCVDGVCADSCGSSSECVSGCCAALEGGGGACGPQAWCAGSCAPTSGSCSVNGDCCNFLQGEGWCVSGTCADSCYYNSDCVSGCCASLSGGGSACAPSYVCG
jgi:hypothetical protein